MDVSKWSQISLTVKYIDEIIVTKDFVTFFYAFDQVQIIQQKSNNDKLRDDEE